MGQQNNKKLKTAKQGKVDLDTLIASSLESLSTNKPEARKKEDENPFIKEWETFGLSLGRRIANEVRPDDRSELRFKIERLLYKATKKANED